NKGSIFDYFRRMGIRSEPTTAVMLICRVFGRPSIFIAGILILYRASSSFKDLPVSIIDFITIRPLKKHIQIKSFISKIVRQSPDMLGIGISYYRIVIQIDYTISIDVPIFDITGAYTFSCITVGRNSGLKNVRSRRSRIEVLKLVISLPDQSIEHPDGLVDFCHIQWQC